jgi:hypothetical protein
MNKSETSIERLKTLRNKVFAGFWVSSFYLFLVRLGFGGFDGLAGLTGSDLLSSAFLRSL